MSHQQVKNGYHKQNTDLPAKRTLGICLGASSVTIVLLESPDIKGRNDFAGKDAAYHVSSYSVHPHGGDPRKTLLSAIEKYETGSIDRIVATGRRFRSFVNLTTISEPEAVELAYRHIKPADVECPAIVSAGGETFMVYILDTHGRISNVLTGNKCASGTGEFFMQQLRRMDVSLEEAARWSATETPHRVSGRCSVFCKSDCTHAINKGIPKSKVTAGLCRMMASKIVELLKQIDKKNIMIVGGAAENRMMVEYLQQDISGLIIPEEAPYFEALGAALWAAENKTSKFPGSAALFRKGISSFDRLPPLKDFSQQVSFGSMPKDRIREHDVCLLGLDVGSTTTKAVLLRAADNALLASIYLYTNGDPVGASRKCYASLYEQVRQQVDPAGIEIIGLGVCGSGRQIAGLHALTDGVINEIMAHAAAAVHFDAQVDTLFEIGGQDAKYTHITGGVPSDYAMNEACSAGTGSFLAESAYETLGVNVEDIAEVALQGDAPPNFNDQCAAFISSDIKTAIHEGVSHEDIVAGLVYSICMNYVNRVKGNRPVGEKVFMQGGVCYNRAVPLAMAALSGKPIIVPPEPGLMGAFGVALEIKKRIDIGLMRPERFDLKTLADREVVYRKPFICKGGREKCDRKCEISVIELDGHRYPFGGACNRYYNLRYNIRYDVAALDHVRERERLVFDLNIAADRNNAPASENRRVGINKSFLVNTYYPFYATFFSALGFTPVLSDTASHEGIDRRNAPFCYPAELSHGFFHALIHMADPPRYLFLPHVRSIPGGNGQTNAHVCPFVQGEPFYLTTTFRQRLDLLKKQGTSVLSPFLDMSSGLQAARNPLLKTARQMGINRSAAQQAFEQAFSRQKACEHEMKQIGSDILSKLEDNPEQTAVVIFGRPYNAFVEEAHMGIPHKLASRGICVIPLDFLPLSGEEAKENMYWGMGQLILRAARFVEKHPQLFGVYITNFSCGPDSFLIGYFRDIMGRKPSLTLELDSHTADAGIETRIEAFLDIVAEYRQISNRSEKSTNHDQAFVPAETIIRNGMPMVKRSDGRILPMNDPDVTFLIPSMGRLSTELFAAVFKAGGFSVASHPPPDEGILKLGRANTTCKECLPLILTTGTLLNYAYHKKRPEETLVYFMASASGPCRFGQYSIFMADLIRRLKIPDVAVFSLTSDNTYSGLEKHIDYYKIWMSIVISDIMEDVRSMILANAKDPGQGVDIFNTEWRRILQKMETGDFQSLLRQLEDTAVRIAKIPMKQLAKQVPTLLLTGEIYVRRDPLSRQYITEKLAEKGFAVICSPISEWIRYSDYILDIDGFWQKMSISEKLRFYIRQMFMRRHENRVNRSLSKTGLLHHGAPDVRTVIRNASHYISPNLGGEAILTIGSAMTEVASSVCGVIAIGPFGCMPNRLSESILSEIMIPSDKFKMNQRGNHLEKILSDIDSLPFLAIESDGSPFPQLIEAKLESFCLRAERLHHKMQQNA